MVGKMTAMFESKLIGIIWGRESYINENICDKKITNRKKNKEVRYEKIYNIFNVYPFYPGEFC